MTAYQMDREVLIDRLSRMTGHSAQPLDYARLVSKPTGRVVTTAAQANTINVVVVKFATTAREALVAALSAQPEMNVVCAAASITDAMAHGCRKRPDLMLIDIGVRGASQIEQARRLRQMHPTARTIFLSGRNDESAAIAAIGSAAEGYLSSYVSSERLINAVRSVSAGDHVFDLSYAAPALKRLSENARQISQLTGHKRLSVLSAREKEIVSLVCQGMTNQQVANAAFVSINTIKTHLRRIFSRLGVSSRIELTNILRDSDG